MAVSQASDPIRPHPNPNPKASRKKRDSLVMHGDEVERAVLPIDVRDELGHLALELRRIGLRGRRHLNENDLIRQSSIWTGLE